MQKMLFIAVALSTQFAHALECLPYSDHLGQSTLCTKQAVVINCQDKKSPEDICYGRVKKIVSADKIKVQTSGKTLTVRIDEISQSVQAVKGVVEGDLVLVAKHSGLGKVTEVFTNGAVGVEYKELPYQSNVNWGLYKLGEYQKAQEVSSEENKKLYYVDYENELNYRSGDVGTIVAKSEDRYLVQIPDFYSGSHWAVVKKSQLKRAVSCLQQRPQICAGQSMTYKGETVFINSIFENDVVYLMTDRGGNAYGWTIRAQDL